MAVTVTALAMKTGTTVSLTTNAFTVPAGDTIFVIVTARGTTPFMGACTDQAGNTYTVIDRAENTTGGIGETVIYMCTNCLALTAQTITCTVSTGTSTSLELWPFDVGGDVNGQTMIAEASAPYIFQNTNSVTTPTALGTTTATNPNAVIFGLIGISSSTTTITNPGAPWTSDSSHVATNQTCAMVHQVVTSTGTYAPAFTFSVAAKSTQVTIGISYAAAGSTATGSITLGGSANAQTPATSAGSITLGGSANAQTPATSSGSITLGGSATAVGGGGNTATGSITLAGAAAAKAPVAATGSITLAGVASSAVLATSSGSIALVGQAVAAIAAAGATGSITFGGVAAWLNPVTRAFAAQGTRTGAQTTQGTRQGPTGATGSRQPPSAVSGSRSGSSAGSPAGFQEYADAYEDTY